MLLTTLSNQLGWADLVGIFTALILAYFTSKVVYNLCWHPLAKFPGPKLAAVSNVSYCYWFLGGRQPFRMLELHNKYGPVVRTAPNELSFNTAKSWKDIYDFRQGHQTFVKSDFYEGGSFADQCGSIVSERDVNRHSKMRRDLSHAFSQRSLTEQEALISGVVDDFITQLGLVGAAGVNIVDWFTMATFDIIGDLAFGETFSGIKSAQKHPWIARIEGAMMQGALADCFKRFPWLAKMVLALFPGKIQDIIKDTKINEDYSINLVTKRINKKTDRKDFLTRILEHQQEAQISDVQIAAHASDLVLAGSETTATALSCITYHLLHFPHTLQALQDEIRGSFKSYAEINAASTAPLKYLWAVCQEGMRLYPPLPFALPRVIPRGGDTVDGHFLPQGTVVSTNPLASCLSASNFEDPLAFKPERWLEKSSEDALDASQPFSMGTRGCLGRSLGWMELRTILAKLHFSYDLQLLDKDVDWHRDSKMHTLWQKPALKIRVLPRSA
ncbi:putative cytochrome P450 [Periconia macrospinosa]|uniref:Putative cytochrome P450 n=1 Tax=Periconia macrospinosa TaxID=97972 RepID=A0A2V1DII5_9PLEO|nr:putative cytochrome P450 [Periconia macrospinosa]